MELRGKRRDMVSGEHEPSEAAEREAQQWSARASALERDGRVGEALEAYLQAVRFDPHDPIHRVRLGLVLRGVGRDEEANLAFQAALDLAGC